MNIHRSPRDVYEDGTNIFMKQLSPRVTLHDEYTHRDVYEDGTNIFMKQLSPRVTLQ